MWAKYSGAVRYEQEHHRDYLNHTPLAPSSDIRYAGLEMFIWLSDVPEELGPTHLVPHANNRRSSRTSPCPTPAMKVRHFTEHEASGAGPAGTVVLYSTDTFPSSDRTDLRGCRPLQYSCELPPCSEHLDLSPFLGRPVVPPGLAAFRYNKRPCANCSSFLAFRHLGTHIGPKRLRQASQPATRGSISHPGRRRHPADWRTGSPAI